MADDSGLKSMNRGDVINGRYEIVRPLGEGMLGSTYVAKHIASDKHVAIKFIHPRLVRNPKDRERLEVAFKAAKVVKHEGIIRYGELGNHDDTVYFTQEYYKAQSLRQLIDEQLAAGKTFTLQEACQLTIKILEAIQCLHDQKLIHRNLKPENVLVHSKPVGPSGQVVRSVKITDICLADIVNPSIFAEGYISREEARYLAPELAAFGQEISSASDLYSAGVIMYELLVGQPPRGTYLAPTTLRDDLPEHVDDVIEVAMASDPADRYPTPQDMINDLQRSFQGLIVSAKPRTSLKNIMIGLGVALIGVAFAGMKASTITPEEQKKSEVELAIAGDDMVRAQASANHPMPSVDEMKKAIGEHKDMLYIPAGPFVMGRLEQEPMSAASPKEPLREVVKVPAFLIDRFEHPNRLKNADGSGVMPSAKTTWSEASEACAAVGKRLCTEQEWEKACKGPENTIYSYADVYDEAMCGKGVNEIHPLGEREACISGYGLADMSGNLREWTATEPKPDRAVVKGGWRNNNQRGTRCAYSTDEGKTFSDSTMGFRCCLTVEAPAPPAEEAAAGDAAKPAAE